MSEAVLTARSARIFLPGIAPRFTRRRAAAAFRRMWRTYWDRQTRRATAAILYALDDRILADIGVDRSEIESLIRDATEERRRCYHSL